MTETDKIVSVSLAAFLRENTSKQTKRNEFDITSICEQGQHSTSAPVRRGVETFYNGEFDLGSG